MINYTRAAFIPSAHVRRMNARRQKKAMRWLIRNGYAASEKEFGWRRAKEDFSIEFVRELARFINKRCDDLFIETLLDKCS